MFRTVSRGGRGRKQWGVSANPWHEVGAGALSTGRSPLSSTQSQEWSPCPQIVGVMGLGSLASIPEHFIAGPGDRRGWECPHGHVAACFLSLTAWGGGF